MQHSKQLLVVLVCAIAVAIGAASSERSIDGAGSKDDCTITLTVAPSPACVDETILAVATLLNPDGSPIAGERVTFGPASVGFDPAAVTTNASGQAIASFSVAAYPGGDGKLAVTATSSKCGTATAEVQIIAVSISPIDIGNKPDISPNIAINAQTAYRQAKWRVSVKPVGSTATVSTIAGPVKVAPNQVDDGDEVTVTLAAPNPQPTDYKLLLAHDARTDCTAEGAGIVFRFEFEDISNTGGPVSRNVPGGCITNVRTAGARRFDIFVLAMSGRNNPRKVNCAQRVFWTYRLVTNPADAFAGRVGNATRISVDSDVNLVAVGVIPSDLGFSGSTTTQSLHTIEIGGLAEGADPQGPEGATQVEVSAPVLLVPVDTRRASFVTEFNQPATVYRVKQNVEVTYTAEVAIERKGVNVGTLGLGRIDSTGFRFVTDVFEIKPE